MMYNWQQQDWPSFKYDLQDIEDLLFAFAEETGHVSGLLKAMPDDMQMEAILHLMVAEAIKTSEIEGEFLSRPDVVSSIRNHLGMNASQEKIKDKSAQGAGELMVAVRKTFAASMTPKMLFTWHEMLLRQSKRIKIGAWRTHKEPMQVVSGAIGREKIHFEAPPSALVPAEMKKFIQWFNNTAPGAKNEIRKAPVRAAVAHLYFETIHPFEDGNGRIGRAIAEKALSQTIGRPVLLSLSHTIEANKKTYYETLKQAQRGNEITAWVKYFVRVVLDAQLHAKKMIDLTIKKARFFDRFKDQFNERQLKVLRKMLEIEGAAFEGGMTASKYMSITKTSKASATRDLQVLADMGVFITEGGGRSVRYSLNI